MIPKKNQAKIALLTRTIKASWKKSVESLIDVGRCLHELKALLDRPAYLKHLAEHLAMSEMHGNRIEHLYIKFHDKKSIHVLSSKPSVLYLLASTTETKKIESLSKGGRVLIGSTYKTLSQFTMKDVIAISESVSKGKQTAQEKDDPEDDDRDKYRARTAHRQLATLVEEINDWSLDLIRFQKSKVEISNKELVRKYVKETIECLEKLNQILS